MNGTVLDRLLNIQHELTSIESQCARERQPTWPLVPIMHEVEDAITEYKVPATKPEQAYL